MDSHPLLLKRQPSTRASMTPERPISDGRRPLAGLRSGALQFGMLALLAVGSGICLADSEQGRERMLVLKRSVPSENELMYWFAVPGKTTTEPRLLPPQAPDGTCTVPIPAGYLEAGCRLDVLLVGKGLVAHLPLEAPRPAAVNLLRNSDFAQDFTPWRLVIPRVSEARADAELLKDVQPPAGLPGHVLRVNVKTPSVKLTDVRLRYAQLDLEEGGSYTFTFWAKSDHPNRIRISANLDEPPFGSIGLNSPVSLNGNWTQFTFPFTATQTVPGHARLLFSMAHVQGSVDLAGITLRRIGETGAAERQPAVVSLAPADFRYAQSVQVPVRYRGKGVYGVIVSVSAEGRQQTQYLETPASRGVARFTDLPVNEPLTVAVSQGSRSLKCERRLSAGRSGSLETVVLPDTWIDVKTVRAAPAPTARGKAPAPAPLGHGQPAVRAEVAPPAPAKKVAPVPRPPAQKEEVHLRQELAPAPAGEPKGDDEKIGTTTVHASSITPDSMPAGARPAPAPPQEPEVGSVLESQPGATPLVPLLVSLLTLLLVAACVFWMADSGRFNGPLARVGIQVTQNSSFGSQSDLLPGNASPILGGKRTGGVHPERPYLMGLKGVYAGCAFSFEGGNVEIGRDPVNGVALVNDSAVSRHHARIECRGDRYVLFDEGSSNGTYVNGVRISRNVPKSLRPGDELSIGASAFRLEV